MDTRLPTASNPTGSAFSNFATELPQAPGSTIPPITGCRRLATTWSCSRACLHRAHGHKFSTV